MLLKSRVRKMEENNNIISAFQFGILAFFLTGGLFVGLGISSIFSLNARDAWIAVLISPIICIIPTLLLIAIINYHPDKNIFEKIKLLFGKWIGTFINIILMVYVLALVVMVLWSNTSFAITMYLTKTPEYFVAGIFIFAAIYAVIKGIEAIARLSEILFFLTLIILATITFTLVFQINLDFLKPTLIKGINPVIMLSFNLSSYLLTPLIMLPAIPKNSITKNKNTIWFLLGGIFMGIMLLFAVFFLIPGVITPELSAIYRFPAYYILRKIDIGGVINNVENFLALHWYFNTFLLITIGIYFISKGIEDLFKVKKSKKKNIIIIVIGLLALWLRGYAFSNSTVAIKFMKYTFPLFFSGTLLILVIIICFLILIRRNKKKAST
jgi:spore germination protein KB